MVRFGIEALEKEVHIPHEPERPYEHDRMTYYVSCFYDSHHHDSHLTIYYE